MQLVPASPDGPPSPLFGSGAQFSESVATIEESSDDEHELSLTQPDGSHRPRRPSAMSPRKGGLPKGKGERKRSVAEPDDLHQEVAALTAAKADLAATVATSLQGLEALRRENSANLHTLSAEADQLQESILLSASWAGECLLLKRFATEFLAGVASTGARRWTVDEGRPTATVLDQFRHDVHVVRERQESDIEELRAAIKASGKVRQAAVDLCEAETARLQDIRAAAARRAQQLAQRTSQERQVLLEAIQAAQVRVAELQKENRSLRNRMLERAGSAEGLRDNVARLDALLLSKDSRLDHAAELSSVLEHDRWRHQREANNLRAQVAKEHQRLEKDAKFFHRIQAERGALQSDLELQKKELQELALALNPSNVERLAQAAAKADQEMERIRLEKDHLQRDIAGVQRAMERLQRQNDALRAEYHRVFAALQDGQAQAEALKGSVAAERLKLTQLKGAKGTSGVSERWTPQRERGVEMAAEAAALRRQHAKVKHASLESRRFFEKQKETLMSELLQASATQGSTIRRSDGPRDPEPRLRRPHSAAPSLRASLSEPMPRLAEAALSARAWSSPAASVTFVARGREEEASSESDVGDSQPSSSSSPEPSARRGARIERLTLGPGVGKKLVRMPGVARNQFPPAVMLGKSLLPPG